MAAFKMENFGGEIPAIDNRLMPDNHAAVAVNTWLLSGRIEPIHALVQLHILRNPEARASSGCPSPRPASITWSIVTGWSLRTRTSV
jgi:hypothetical protein